MMIEHRHHTKQGEEWWSLTHSAFNPGQNYTLFGLLAGVRGEESLHEPRGIPADISSYTKQAFYLWASDDGFECADGRIYPRTTIARWVAQGISEWLDDHWATDGDWHTPSWLTTAEFAEALRRHAAGTYADGSPRRYDVEYAMTLGAMVAAEESGHQCRIVFWFDN